MDDIWPYEKPRFGLSAWNGQIGRLQGYPVARADRGAGARFGIGARLARLTRTYE